MGSAAAYHLARAGARVLGLDRFSPPHALGSTHGRSRIIREAYYEHPSYVPLLRRAYELWDRLEREGATQLFVKTGGLMIGPPEGELVSGALASARTHGVPHELLDADDLRARCPDFRPGPEMVAVLELRAGLLLPERCVETHLALARRHGASLRTNETVDDWSAGDRGVTVRTTAGRYRARRLVLAAGPWMPELARAPRIPLVVERQCFHWFAPATADARLDATRAPIALWEYAPERLFATFPDLGDGVKAGIHHEGAITDPERVDRTPSDSDERLIRELLATYLPAANGALRDALVCLYTNTPDHHFVLDAHPAHENVVIASPCSGHGFKFASVIGEVLADFALGRSHSFDLSLFRAGRFGVAAAS